MSFKSEKIDRDSNLFNYINNRSYRDNLDIELGDLRYITIYYYNFNNSICIGHLIVNKIIEEDILYIFSELYNNRYQLYSVKLIEEFWSGDNLSTDKLSMKNNNSSCFNYRLIDGSNRLSYHALGLAVDINPVNNPYIINRNGVLDYSDLNDEGLYYASNRDKSIPHVITHNDLAYKLFTERGFIWGGDWDSKYRSIDYQHFEKILKR